MVIACIVLKPNLNMNVVQLGDFLLWKYTITESKVSENSDIES
jgi:hypothetical protein